MVSSLLPLIIAVLGGGGFIGAIIALIKLRPESGQIVVTAAQGALIVQSGVIDSLKNENVRQQERIALLERENAMLRARVATLEIELHMLRDEVHDRKDKR